MNDSQSPAGGRGSVIIESALVVSVLLLVIGGAWSVYARDDMIKTIYAAVYRGLNDPSNKIFTTDAAGNPAKWVDGAPPDVQSNLLNAVNAKINDSLATSSSLSAGASSAACLITLGYVDIDPNTGNGTSSYELVPAITLPYDNLETMIDQEASNYVSHFDGKILNTEQAKTLTDAETLPQFPGGSAGAAAAATVGVYYPWAPFFVWACEANVLAIFNIFSPSTVNVSGVFVPNR